MLFAITTAAVSNLANPFSAKSPRSDFTGINIVSRLTANSEYNYQASWFCSDGTLEDPLNGESLDWTDNIQLPYRFPQDPTVERITRATMSYTKKANPGICIINNYR